MAGQILRSSPSFSSGIVQILHAAMSARKALSTAAFMVHYIVEGVDDGEAKSRAHRVRQICAPLGREIPGTVPAIVRDMPFAPLYNVMGPSGERWVPLHGIVPHSAASGFHAALMAFYAARAEEMKRLGVWTGGMFATVGSSGFLYEIALYWPDTTSAYHRQAVDGAYLAGLPQYAENAAAREYVHQLKEEMIALLSDHGAINFQIGKSYPYAKSLEQAPRGLVGAIKQYLDPKGKMSPGNLGL
jgi:D-lactate dehydrogenase (cytochrome)